MHTLKKYRLHQMENLSKTQIPDKLYFKIGEASAITGLADYVLRFWESEFKAICPRRTDSGQRLYRKADIQAILTIKELLYEKKFTIEGAKKHLEKSREPSPAADNEIIENIRKELIKIRNMLDE